MRDDAFERGRALRAAIFGPEGMKSLEQADSFQEPLQDLVTRICFGEVWSREGLSLKIRSMLTVAILVGQSRPNQLRNHVKGALANGVTREELREILLHATLYHGLPAGTDSWAIVTGVLKELDTHG